MFLSIFQSLTGLIFTGTFLYAILMSERLTRAVRTQQIMVGAAFGILAASLASQGLSMQPLHAELDIKAGPLIFAGYLGGPIGALVAAAMWTLFRILFDGQATGFSPNLALVFPIIGLIVRCLVPSKNPNVIPSRAIVYIALGFVIFQIGHVVVHPFIFNPDNKWECLHKAVLASTSIGGTSIALTTLITVIAQHFASQVSKATLLAKRLHFALKHTKVGLFERSLEDYRGTVDEVYVSIYGLPPGTTSVTRSEWLGSIYHDDIPTVLAAMREINSPTHDQGIFDYRIIRPDGKIRDIHENWIGEFDRNGKKLGIIAIHFDVTDIREAERVHLESMARVALIADNLPGVVFQIDITDPNNTNIIYIGPKCLSLWEYTDQELYADNSLLVTAHDPQDRPVFLAAVRQSITTATPFSHRYMITARDGSTRWLEFRGGPIFSNDRVMIEAIILDVTSEVQVQQQIEKEREISHRAQKIESIGQLTGGVAHDFNNLLTVILGNLELLMDETDPAMHAELITNAITATMRGAELTKSMLSFARKARLTPVILDLNAVVRDAQTWIGRTMPKSVVIDTTLSANLWPIEADLSSLENSLLNLILNARDAMLGSGNVTIATSNVVIDASDIQNQQGELAPGRYVMLTAKDTGEGIAPDNLALIFEPFFTTKRQGEGSGLGLSMIVGFMKQSGGTVQVESNPDQGTTFKLYFPAANTADTSAEASKTEKTETGTSLGRILVAEDEHAVRAAIVTMLERAGYLVTQTASGDEAYSVFSKDPTFDLLLTDIVMPGKLQGTHLAQKIRHKWPDLPIVFMSGYASDAHMNCDGVKAGDTRLMKPVRRADLLAALAKALE
jgi:PAS domain S-box-containing protein